MSDIMATVDTDAIQEPALASLRRRFAVVAEAFAIGGRRFEFFRPRSADDLISEEDFDRDERLPYWAELWTSSLALAERLFGGSGRGGGSWNWAPASDWWPPRPPPPAMP